MPELESVNRLYNIPIVEMGWNYGLQIYTKIKQSNNIINYTLDQAEDSLFQAVETALPAVVLFGGPLSSIDKFICKSLDIVEERVPSICLPPQAVYWNTKQYVTDVSTKIVRPVLKRADSVKQIGNSVLSSKYTAFAADRLDGALDVADKYMDKYLPDDASDQPTDEPKDENQIATIDNPAGKAIHTIHHVDRFSRKLQRRLTRRTLAEAKALKDQSAEAIHVLVYVAELVATDPKLAFQKGKELWASLSKDEPENQARPATLEQLIVMLTRESARRVVHLINFTSVKLGKLPTQVSQTVLSATNQCLQMVDSLIKAVHMESVKKATIDKLGERMKDLETVLKKLNSSTTLILEHLANVLRSNGRNPSKSAIKPAVQNNRPSNRPKNNASNGVEVSST